MKVIKKISLTFNHLLLHINNQVTTSHSVHLLDIINTNSVIIIITVR